MYNQFSTLHNYFTVLSEIAEQNQNESTIDKEQKKEKRRKKVTKELFETEKTYLNHLDLVNKVQNIVQLPNQLTLDISYNMQNLFYFID